jgi:uncharacterized protein YjbI with pentapeptide repeats
MANQRHLHLVEQGVETWNQWRLEHPTIVPDLRKANLEGRVLKGIQLGSADLREAFLLEADLEDADLKDAQLGSACLNTADLMKVNLAGADLNFANLVGANLSDAELVGANLEFANLDGINLTRAHLSGVNFTSASLKGANLTRADLRNAHLADNDLTYADLTHADLSSAYLDHINFTKASFMEANLSGITLWYANFGDVDLSSVKGLGSVKHRGPSTIGIDTIYRSRGRIPEVFLLGAGIPQSFIEYMSLLVGKLIAYYTCFISYSNKDEAFARRLYTDFQSQGVRCWFAPEDLKIGDHYHQRIDESIHSYDKLILILSEHAVESAWVEREVVSAREKEDQLGHEVLFPISLDNAVMQTTKAWAADVRRRWHIGDFTRWKDHDTYQQAFERLLRDLKAAVEP